MEIVGEFTFNLPQETVWEVLHDPKALAYIIPMLMDLKQVNENEYSGALFFKVGTIAGTFRGKLELTNIQAPDSYDLKVQGNSPIGQVHIEGGMRLEARDDHTIMFYHGNANFGGRIVSVGSRLLEVAIKSIMQQSFETLNRYLTLKYKKS
jgi:carbon monoxide dehydrogenase subunit G